jgi:hypothetical protein
MCAWSKLELGWVTPIDILDDEDADDGVHVYTIRRSCDFADVYKISQGFPEGEYLLIENRQPCGYDQLLPQGQGGLAIWHIDLGSMETSDTYNFQTQGYPSQTGWPENGNHYRIALLQADGGYDLEQGTDHGDAGDLFGSTTAKAIGPDGITTTANGGQKIKYPNTQSYQGGNIKDTHVYIGNIISPSGGDDSTMTFEVSFGGAPPTPSPTRLPLNLFQVELEFDHWPVDVGFFIARLDDQQDDAGVSIVASKAQGFYAMGTPFATETFLLDAGEYEFQITDAFGGESVLRCVLVYL